MTMRDSPPTGVFDARIEPEGGLSDARRADHQHMNVARIHNRRDGFLAGASHHNALWNRFVTDSRCLTFLRLSAPLLRRKGDVLIDTHDFLACRPSSRAVLAVADGLALDVVERHVVGEIRNSTENADH